MIHTTADFEYANLIDFHPEAITVAKKVLGSGCHIYADTAMIQQGIHRPLKEARNIQVSNFVHDKDVYLVSKDKGITRSMAGIEKAMSSENISIFAIGNAPTALFQIKACIEAGFKKPDLIIGVPVGFVGAQESKEMLEALNIPYIRIRGRKGGSPVAVAIINGLLKLI